MTFWLTVPVVMILVIISVHAAAKFFQLEISYLTLTICAVLSIVIDVAAAATSTAPNADYFLKLFVLIFVAAAVVTAVNIFLEVKK